MLDQKGEKNLYRELFSIGSLTVYSYGLMIALGVLISAVAIYREAPREKLNPDYVLEAVVASTFAGLIGARLLYVFLNWSYYSANPVEILFARFEGLSFYGGFILGATMLFFWCYWRKLSFLRLADLMAPYLALGYAFGRIGCFLNGCCYGLESDLPWALPAAMTDDITRHPVQLYAALGALILFAALKLLRPKRPFVGFLLVALFGLYGVLRFTTEFFRQEEAAWIGLSAAQIFSLAIIILATAVALIISGIKIKPFPPAGGKKNKTGNVPPIKGGTKNKDRDDKHGDGSPFDAPG